MLFNIFISLLATSATVLAYATHQDETVDGSSTEVNGILGRPPHKTTSTRTRRGGATRSTVTITSTVRGDPITITSTTRGDPRTFTTTVRDDPVTVTSTTRGRPITVTATTRGDPITVTTTRRGDPVTTTSTIRGDPITVTRSTQGDPVTVTETSTTTRRGQRPTTTTLTQTNVITTTRSGPRSTFTVRRTSTITVTDPSSPTAGPNQLIINGYRQNFCGSRASGNGQLDNTAVLILDVPTGQANTNSVCGTFSRDAQNDGIVQSLRFTRNPATLALNRCSLQLFSDDNCGSRISQISLGSGQDGRCQDNFNGAWSARIVCGKSGNGNGNGNGNGW